MNKILGENKLYIIGGLFLVFAIAVITTSVYAEGGFKKNKYSKEARVEIHNAFESSDYDAYVNALNNIEKNPISEDEFNIRAEKIANKKAVYQSFIDNDYETYVSLTEGSYKQLTESAFIKKVEMVGIKEDIKIALKDRNYEAFLEAKESLESLKHSDEFEEKDEISEEKFNELADEFEKYGDKMLFYGHKNKKGHDSKRKYGDKDERKYSDKGDR